MYLISPLRWLSLLALSLLSLGCGGSDGDSSNGSTSGCQADVAGTVFGLDQGTATLSGTIYLPPDTPAGLSINLMLVEEGSAARRGVVPDFGGSLLSPRCTAGLKTRGSSFTYQINALEAGSYQLHLKLKNSDSEDVYNSTSTMVIMVSDDDVLMHDEDFAAAP